MGKKIHVFLDINVGFLIRKQYPKNVTKFQIQANHKKILDGLESYAFWKTDSKHRYIYTYIYTNKEP